EGDGRGGFYIGVDEVITHFDSSGNAVGNFGPLSNAGPYAVDRLGDTYSVVGNRIRVRDPNGTLTRTILLDRDYFWPIDLAGDQCTLYQSETSQLNRFDVCTGQVLTPLLLDSPDALGDLRLLS